MYENETLFAKAVVDQLKVCGNIKVTKIETRTESGVPDLYVAGSWGTRWVELKVMNCLFKHSKMLSVPFRAGQQKWAAEHHFVTGYSEAVLLLAAFKNGIYCCSLRKFYEGKKIPAHDWSYVSDLGDGLIHHLKLKNCLGLQR